MKTIKTNTITRKKQTYRNGSEQKNNNNNNDDVFYDPKAVHRDGRGKNEIHIVPRSVKLLEELEMSENEVVNERDLCKKYPNDINWINYGLDGFDDPSMTMWNAATVPVQDTSIGDRTYQPKMITAQGYPKDPPFLTFAQVNFTFVDADGTVLDKFEWYRENTIRLCKDQGSKNSRIDMISLEGTKV